MPSASGSPRCCKSPAWFLLGVNAALFVIGMFIETSAAIIVLAPILVPVAVHFGVDPVHFGIIMVVNLAMGMITPPFGVNLFAACTVAKISLDRIVGHLLPFVLVIMACLMLITYVPSDLAGPARPGVCPRRLGGAQHSPGHRSPVISGKHHHGLPSPHRQHRRALVFRARPCP